jgi:hypothetical protein
MKKLETKNSKKTPKQDLLEKLSTKLHQAIKSLGVDSVLLSNKIEKSAKKLVKSVLKKKAVTAKKVNKPLVSTVAIKKSIQTKPVKTATTTSPAKPKVSAAKPKVSASKPKVSAAKPKVSASKPKTSPKTTTTKKTS